LIYSFAQYIDFSVLVNGSGGNANTIYYDVNTQERSKFQQAGAAPAFPEDQKPPKRMDNLLSVN